MLKQEPDSGLGIGLAPSVGLSRGLQSPGQGITADGHMLSERDLWNLVPAERLRTNVVAMLWGV